MHPLGKSPIITIELPTPGAKPIVLAESGLITEYLCEHWGRGTTLVPKQWQEGKENQLGGETAAYLRHKYILHFAEGTMMPYLVFFLVTSNLKSTQVPWYIRPISTAIANKINSTFILPNVRRNLELVESFLANPPSAEDGTGYLCGDHLTAADILLSFPLIASRMRAAELGDLAAEFPKTFEYVERLEKEPGYLASIKKVEEIDGKFSSLL